MLSAYWDCSLHASLSPFWSGYSPGAFLLLSFLVHLPYVESVSRSSFWDLPHPISSAVFELVPERSFLVSVVLLVMVVLLALFSLEQAFFPDSSGLDCD